MEFASKVAYCNPTEEYDEVLENDEEGIADSYRGKLEESDDGETCLVDILDTAGQEEYSALRDTYYRQCGGMIIMYDITRRDTLLEAVGIREQVVRVRDETIPIIFAGNKIDLEDERVVSTEEGQEIAKSLGALFIETSAKLRTNIEETIHELIRRIPRNGIEYSLAIVGSGAVGKSSFCVQFTMHRFVEEYDPTIEDSYRRQIHVPGLLMNEKEKKSGKVSRLRQLFSKRGKKEEKCAVKKKVRKATTNVLMMNFSSLADESGIVIENKKPLKCCSCDGVCTEVDGSSSSWRCSICGEDNDITDREKYASVQEGSVAEYVLSSADECNGCEDDESIVVFCVDISGSMGCTSEIPLGHGFVQVGNTRAKQKLEDVKREFVDDGSWQRLPNERSGITYVSRLDCMKTALEKQLEEISLENGRKQVMTVLFNNEVRVLGDALGKEDVVFGGGVLSDYDRLKNEGEKIVDSEDSTLHPISQSRVSLANRVREVEEGGATALGPALLVSLGMTSGRRGSEIIVFTDGLANVGLGSFDTVDEKERETARDFYNNMGLLGKNNGVSISVLCVEGSECGLELLESCSELTSGNVNAINPLEMQRQMREIVDKPLVGTNVEAKIFACSDVVFVGTTAGEYGIHTGRSGEKGSCSTITCDIGNATAESGFTVEYELQEESLKKKEASFQAQVKFTRSDGAKCMRVYTQILGITNNRKKAEGACDVAILSVNAVQQAARRAGMNDDERAKARDRLISTEQLFERACTTSVQQEEHSNFVRETAALDGLLGRKQAKGETDRARSTVYKSRHASINTFLTGSRKGTVVSRRKKHVSTVSGECEVSEGSSGGEVEEKQRRGQDEQTCVICEDKRIDTVFLPCGHMVVCHACSEKSELMGQNTCPYCRQAIEKRVRTYGR